ncbi:LysM peptidoglycan-binding domain-containing protein [Spirulina sp. CS-785/01]|uniref:LysM peptidoglycan-binding domain-containing protein n=1 Tax=Spirulina sp. CS-785/01 TaxID=3021716 RepID=UPI002331391B|nr:LysM peptidoglycan-binding domain-containing protein [Spirulina sp. CS-785/01]MDB9312020.1 LysM peptidoglycan-binding domain-containing protein [Spirulina sp. CS-785/01]
MKTSLTCPVCDRPQIEGNTCPNCETDLSLIRQLMELPVVSTPSKPPKLTSWVLIAVALILLLFGVGVGAVGNAVYVQQQDTSIATNSPTQPSLVSPPNPVSPLPTITPNDEQSSPTCGGFYYQVRRGDSISRIALKLYGNGTLWPRIVNANPQLQGRENTLKIGELLFVPNLEKNCS